MRSPLLPLTLLLTAGCVAHGAPSVPLNAGLLAAGSEPAFAAPAGPDTSQTQTLPLQYARPWDLLKLMHWDASAASLPVGVRQIQASPAANALRVDGTPEGVARVQDIVRVLDLKPRFVGVRVRLIRATRTDVDAQGINFDPIPGSGRLNSGQSHYGVASGEIVSQMFHSLTQAHPGMGAASEVSTANNVPASASARLMFPGLGTDAAGSERYPIGAQAGVAVTPRINSDGTITVALTPSVSVDGPVRPQGQGFTILRTVKDGETLVLTGFDVDAQTEMLLFVTPRLL